MNQTVEKYLDSNAIYRPWIQANSLRLNLALGLTCAFLLGVIFNETRLNILITTMIADGTNGFPLRGDWFVERVLHYYGGKVTIVIALSVIGFNLTQWLRPSVSDKAIVCGRYLMVSWLCSIVTIGIIKHTSSLPCPVDLKVFGGDWIYVSLIDLYAKNLPIGGCFPAAHSSGGYSLMAFGFIALVYARPFFPALLPGFLIGLVYGVAQILRGMHFPSHDFFTFIVCLGFAWLWAEFYLFKKMQYRPK